MLIALLVLYTIVLAWAAWRRRPWLGDALIPGLLALFTSAFFWRLLSGDAFMPADGGDLGSFLFPTYSFIQHSLHEGVWPLWNPHLYSGAPFVAEVQSGILYPPHLLRFLVGPQLRYADMQWLALLHIWWAGVTTYFLARGLRLWRMPALLAAAAFMFSDLFLVHFGNLNLIAVASWLPLALLGVHHSLENGRLRGALAAGLALGIGGLAGHIQMTLYSLMAVAMWTALWLLLRRGDKQARWRQAILTALVTSLVTIGLIAPILLPGFEFAALTERAAWRYAETVGYSLSPAQLIGLLLPNFFGRGPALHWGLWPRVEVGYIGVLTLLLALVGLVLRRDRLTWLLLGLAALSLAFSLGIYSIVHGWLTWLLPGLEQLRAPARFIVVFDLGLVLLAARGLQTLLEPWSAAEGANFAPLWRFLRTLLIATLAVGVPLTYAVLLLTHNLDAALHLRASVGAIAVMDFLLLFGASLALLYARQRDWIRPDLLAPLAIALILVDLASLGAYEDIAAADPTANFHRQGILDFLHSDADLYRLDARTDIDALWQPDTAQLHGLYDVWGVANPLTLSYYVASWNTLGSRSTDLYALHNTKYLLGRKDVVLDQHVWEVVYDADPDLNVYRNRRFQPRAHLLGQARPAPDLATAQAATHAPDFSPLTEVVLEGGEAQDGAGFVASAPRPELGTKAQPSGGDAQITSFGVNDVVVATESVGPGTLLVAQTWYPGWQARIDGGPWQPVLRADGVWQAVQVAAGQHEIRLRFRSQPFVVGLVIAVATLLLATLLLAVKTPQARNE